MNLRDVKDRVKRQFGDEAQVQISDVDIIRWANDGQRYITTNNPDANQVTLTTNLVAGQQSYTLPTNLYILSSVHIKQYASDTSYFHIEGASLQEFNNTINGWDGTGVSSPGIPVIYNKYANTINLFPAPKSDITAGLKLYYSRYPTDLANNTDVIDLPLEYHSAIVDYCLQQAYELDEDWPASQAKAGQIVATLHINKNRGHSKAQETYGTITTLDDDL